MTFTRSSLILMFALSSLTACGDETGGDDSTSDTTSTTADSSPTTSSASTLDTSTSTPVDTSSSDDGTSTGEDTTGTDSGEVSGTDDGSTTASASLEIAGSWTDGFGGTHDIADAAWIQTYGEDVFPYTITQFDNDTRVVIAQDDGDGSWSKFDWTWQDDALWYCQSSFGLESEDAAVAAPSADPADPAAGGCGGFPWSPLTPA